MVQVYIALGTNLGDRRANLRTALLELQAIVSPDLVSAVYETEPWGVADQPWFLNMVVKGDTLAGPIELLTALKQIEMKMGRRATIRYGPRLIDLDLLAYGELEVHTEILRLPHPRVAGRAFVLHPLAEIAPDFRLPGQERTVAQMLKALQRSEQVRYLGPLIQ